MNLSPLQTACRRYKRLWRRQRPVLMIDIVANVLAGLLFSLVGFGVGNLTLIAAVGQPLTSLCIRGFYSLRGAYGVHASARLAILVTLMAASGLPFVAYIMTHASHDLFRPKPADAPLLLGAATVLLLSLLPRMLLHWQQSRSNGWERLDILLVLLAISTCVISAGVNAWSDHWLMDGAAAVLMFALLQARVLIWTLVELFQP